MSVGLMEIAARSKVEPVALSAINDFTLRPLDQISEADLLGSPDWTLYCLDIPCKQALFVELSRGSDLFEAAFAYAQQFTDARRAALMSFDQLIATSHAIAAPSELAFLFSTGRCGSTLASRIFTPARRLEPVGARLPDQPRSRALGPCARRSIRPPLRVL